MKKNRSFKKELIYSFLTIGLLSIVLLGIFQIYHVKTLVNENQNSQIRMTDFLEDYIKNYVQQHERIIQTMSQNISQLYEQKDYGKIKEKLEEVKENYPGFLNLYVGDKSGHSLVFFPDVYSDGAKRESLDFSDRSYYKELLRKKDTVISPIFHGRGGTDKLLVTIVSPIFNDDGKMQGYILGGLDLSELESYVKSRILGKASHAVVLDQDYNAIIHPDVDARTEIANFSDSPVVKYMQKEKGSGKRSMSYKSDNGKSEFITYAKLSNPDWTIWIANPTTVITNTYKKSILTILIFVFITSIVVVTASLILTHRLERVIRALLTYIKDYTKGYQKKKTVEVKQTIQGPKEMEQLLIYFNDLMEEISDGREKLMRLNADLEKRVQERTANLENKNNELSAVNKLITSVTSERDMAHFIQHCLQDITEFTQFDIHVFYQDKAVTSREIHAIPDYQTYFNAFTPSASQLVEPIVFGNSRKGFLAVNLDKDQSVTGNDREFLQTFARSLAIMLQNKELYELYRDKHAELEAVLESMFEGIMLLDNQQQIKYVNEFFWNIIENESHSSAALKNMDDVRKRFTAMFEVEEETLASFFNNEDGELKLEYKKETGKTDFYMLNKFSVVSDQKSVGEGLLIRDITKEEEIDTLKNNLISLTSHEFKTPITNIKGSVETLLRPDVEWDALFQQELLEGVHEDIDRIQHLVNDWMDISKIESGTMYVERNMIRADHVIEESLELVPMALREDASFNFYNKASEYLFFYADKHRVQQVLLNLFTNALRYNDRTEKKIAVTLSTDDDYLTISVSDNGIGISEEHLEKIFNRFYQVDVTATRRSGGTGLGLAICKGIMEAHEGKITVSSSPDTGSTFTLYFPLTKGR
ncbi:ATP-binding protein [Virgibacillus halophilus]|uniref:ATP-binding protein n=1 Tax=Tigheibacillus halophilus TaxID=361280 RepID=UPI00362BC3A6